MVSTGPKNSMHTNNTHMGEKSHEFLRWVALRFLINESLVTLLSEQISQASSMHGKFNFIALKHFLFSVHLVGFQLIDFGASLALSHSLSGGAFSLMLANVFSLLGLNLKRSQHVYSLGVPTIHERCVSE